MSVVNFKDTNIIEYIIESSKDHLENNGENPQSYFKHLQFACLNSAILIYSGVIGIIHAVFPFLFKFTTSSIVIKSMKKLLESKRHKKELREIMRDGYLLKKFTD